MPEWKFQLGDRVELAESSEAGGIIGRAQYLVGENQYQLRYRAGDGRQIETWWGESALRAGNSDAPSLRAV